MVASSCDSALDALPFDSLRGDGKLHRPGGRDFAQRCADDDNLLVAFPLVRRRILRVCLSRKRQQADGGER